MVDLREVAVSAWEDHAETSLVASARAGLSGVLGSDVADGLTVVDTSRLDGVRIVVFVDAEGVHVAGRRLDGDAWETLLVSEDDGWVKRAGPFASLPDLGEWFLTDGGQVADWQVGEVVEVGDLRSYDGQVYECIQAHTTQADWTPPESPSLWTAV